MSENLSQAYERLASIGELRVALEEGLAELRDDAGLREAIGLDIAEIDLVEIEISEDRAGLSGAEVIVAIGVGAAGRISGEILVALWTRVLWPKIRDLVGRKK